MAKVSLNRNNFNAGVFSPLVEGRVDIDKYPASMRSMINFVAAPQGPAIRRSGTYFVGASYKPDKYSHLIPFIFNEDQALALEFSDLRLRFLLEEGIQAYDNDAITAILATTPMQFTSAALTARGAGVGSQVSLSGFPVVYNINGVVANVTAKSGDNYTVDIDYIGAVGAVTERNAALLYEIESPYAHEDVHLLRAVQSVDTLYLYCEGYKPRKLSRYGAYDWRFALMKLNTGPFKPVDDENGKISPSGTGNPVPVMTANNLPSGLAYASSESGTQGGATYDPSNGAPAPAYYAFNGDLDTQWASNTNQHGIIGYAFTAGVVVNAYTIYIGRGNTDATYTAIDYAPGDFELWGYNNDTSAFELLDVQKDYVLYEGGRSATIPVKNTFAYTKYELRITKCTRNGPIAPRVSRLVFNTSDEDITDITLTLSGSYTKLNNGVGFKSTDVGRYLRVKGSDSFWRRLQISAYTSATSVDAIIVDEPLPDLSLIREWQIAYWSDTTGYPYAAIFFDDRNWVAGSTEAPDLVAGSRVGAYEDFTQRTPQNEVLDDSAIVVRLNTRRLSRIQWLETDERGLLIGTGSAEWVITATGDSTVLTARNPKSRSSTARGSAFIEPVKVDRQVLYIPAARRTVREYAYVFQADGYQSPSMSLFASHMGVPRFAQMTYTAEPHSIVWLRRDDGSVVGLTYDRDENIIGWHNHDFGGVVESTTSLPSAVDKQDILWLVVKRTIDNQERRYIERLVRFWDFDSAVEDAHFVDCGLRYDGEETDTLYGLPHLESRYVEGLADGIPFGPLMVEGGMITLPFKASIIVVGLAYVSYGETSNIEAGAADGTAQGKQKRPHNCSVSLWSSAYGQIGRYNEDQEIDEWRDIEYKEPYDELQPINLQTFIAGPFDMPAGYGKRGSLLFRQTKPLPFNVVALLPQMHTQDR